MRRGLIVGKFMPLHRGHQLLIESALAEVDELVVVIYNTQVDNASNMPINKRIRWIADLYPQVKAVVPRNDPLSGSYAAHDDPKYARVYADDLDFLGPFTHVFSSEEYGQPFAQALGAEHVMVDAARKLVPISGTQIRENPFENRGYIDPYVYRSLIQKVVFVGTESTGKSTLAHAMAEFYKTKWVHEYGRELWVEQNGGSFEDLLKVGTTQYERERAAALHSRDYLFCDTNAWTTLQWSLMYHGTADARLHQLVDRTINEYVWILCDNDFGWVNDGTREMAGDKAEKFQFQNSKDLDLRGIRYHLVTGNVANRIHQVEHILDNLK